MEKVFCNLNEISCNNINHFGSGVATRFKKINPFMSSNHCVSHRLHLAGKDASDKVTYFQKYEKTLHNLYGYFSRSHNRQDILELIYLLFY